MAIPFLTKDMYRFRSRDGKTVIEGLTGEQAAALDEEDRKKFESSQAMGGLATATQELQKVAQPPAMPTPVPTPAAAEPEQVTPQQATQFGELFGKSLATMPALQPEPQKNRVIKAAMKYNLGSIYPTAAGLEAQKALEGKAQDLQKAADIDQSTGLVKQGVGQFMNKFLDESGKLKPEANVASMLDAFGQLQANTGLPENTPGFAAIKDLIEVAKKAGTSSLAFEPIQPGSLEAKIAEWGVNNNQPLSSVMTSFGGFGKNPVKPAVLAYMIDYARQIGKEYKDTEAQTALAGSKAGATGFAGTTGSGEAKVDTGEFINNVQKDWSKTVADYNEGYQQYNLGKQAPNTPAGQVALVKALEKVREQNSAVMYGDFQTWTQAGNFLADVVQSGLWDATNQRLLQGLLPPEKVKDMQDMLDRMYTNRQQFLKSARDSKAEMAKLDWGWKDDRINRVFRYPAGFGDNTKPPKQPDSTGVTRIKYVRVNGKLVRQ